MTGPIYITPWWLRLIGRPPFRRYSVHYTGDMWIYMTFGDAMLEAEHMRENGEIA